MTDPRKLVRKFEPVLRFGTDGDGRPERFFPISARDYVHRCGLRRRKVGWIQQPGDTYLFQLSRLPRPDTCYLVFAAGDLRSEPGVASQVVLEMIDRGLELARQHPADGIVPEAIATNDVLPRLLLPTQQAAELEANLATITIVDRRPVLAETLTQWLSAGTGLQEDTVGGLDRNAGRKSAANALERLEFATANLEWVEFPALAPLPVVIRDRALGKYEPCLDWQRFPPVYHYHVVTDRGYTVLQYWFLYAYNNWASHGGHNDHEGDWEAVSVFLDAHDQARYVACSRHVTIPFLYGPAVTPWTAVEKIGGTHPVVYVGCGSHANYPKSGTFRFFLYPDHANGSHLAIGPDAEQPWAEPVSLRGKRWNARFSGSWGALVKHWLGKVLPHTEGPSGPAHKSDKWSHPAQWAGIPAL